MARTIQVTTTTATREDAERIAETLVERRLAACVQVVGSVRSVYRWKGNMERADEWLLIVKSVPSRYEAIEQAIRELHPYETPEIIAVEVARGSDEYERWIAAETQG